MTSDWLQSTILHTASLLAPGDQRDEWLAAWRSELWYVPRRGATRFCLGAFRDAFWVRRNNLSPVKPALVHLESPLGCLAFLAALAAVSLFIAVHVVLPSKGSWPPHLRVRDLPAGCAAMLLYSFLLLPATRLAIGLAPENRHPMPRGTRLRRWVFLALKVVLVQPIMLGGFVAVLRLGPLIPMLPSLGIFAIWILTYRWVILDQRGRCPVCLRLLTDPVRIGNVSETFLEWYGGEQMCSRGHGLLQVPEISASYGGKQQWLNLDASWSGLFSEAAGRQR